MDTNNKIENIKYYTPEIEEFYIGFEFEEEFNNSNWTKMVKPIGDNYEWVKLTLDTSHSISRITSKIKKAKIRVKYLDEQDILDLGFTKDKKYYEAGIIGHNEFIRVDGNNNNIVKIQTYWRYSKNEREDLIRVFKGTKYNYPYSEIFRGKIKNKTEFKKLLKMLDIKI